MAQRDPDTVALPRATELGPPLAASIVTWLPLFLVGSMAVQLRVAFDMSPAGLGLASGSFSAGGVASAVMAGRLADRLSAAAGLRLATLSAALAMFSIAAFARSFGVLLVLLAICGASASLGAAAANLALSRLIDPRRLGFALGVKQAAIPVGTMIAGLAVPAVALTVGWRWAFVGASGLAVLAAATIPRSMTEMRIDRNPERQSTATPAMLLLALGVGFAAGSVSLLSSFLVDSATEIGVSNATAGWLVVIGSIFGLTTRVASGLRADRRGGRHLVVVARMLVMGAVLFGLLALHVKAVFVLVAPIAYSAAWGWNGVFHFAIVNANRDAPGTATGIVQTGALAGALSIVIVGGLIAREYSYVAVWILAAICSALGAAIILLGRRTMIRSISRSHQGLFGATG